MPCRRQLSRGFVKTDYFAATSIRYVSLPLHCFAFFFREPLQSQSASSITHSNMQLALCCSRRFHSALIWSLAGTASLFFLRTAKRLKVIDVDVMWSSHKMIKIFRKKIDTKSFCHGRCINENPGGCDIIRRVTPLETSTFTHRGTDSKANATLWGTIPTQHNAPRWNGINLPIDECKHNFCLFTFNKGLGSPWSRAR